MKIPKPEIDVRDVFDLCISNMHESNKRKYLPCLDEIIVATENYEINMAQGTPQNVSVSQQVAGVPRKEVEKLYVDKLSKAKQPARKYYNQIMDAAPRGICPYCHQQIASTLDHYYPKAHYPALIISPTNLVPACSNCNKNKLDTVIEKKEDAVLNPYFEDADQVIWLKAILKEDLESEFLTMTFCVDSEIDCDSDLRQRLENQFELLQLNRLYSSHAAEELIAISRRAVQIYKVRGTEEVRSSIREAVQINDYRPNSWQMAMLKAVDNDWFYDCWLPLQAQRLDEQIKK